MRTKNFQNKNINFLYLKKKNNNFLRFDKIAGLNVNNAKELVLSIDYTNLFDNWAILIRAHLFLPLILMNFSKYNTITHTQNKNKKQTNKKKKPPNKIIKFYFSIKFAICSQN